MLPTRSRFTFWPLLLTIALAAGCSQSFVKSFSDLLALRQALSTHFQHPDINVVIQNGDALGITFINSRFNELGEDERGRKAQEIAAFAKAHYAHIQPIKRIWVAFATRKTYFLFFHSFWVHDSYLFDKDNIEAGDLSRTAVVAAEAIKPTTSYSQARDETTVMINHLLLAGGVQNKLLLVPSFAVPGRHLSAPAQVDFDFASYSDRALFVQDHSVAITVDGKKVLAGAAQYSSGQGNEGTVIEYLSYKIPYQQFLRMAQARSVELRLGAREIELTSDQIELLRGLKGCVDAGACP